MHLRDVAVLVLALCGPAAAGPTYIHFNVPGAHDTTVTAINATGTVTGRTIGQNIAGCSHFCGYLRSPDGSIAVFEVAGAKQTIPSGINNDGAVTGVSSNGQGFIRAADGSMTTFGVREQPVVEPRAIGGDGVVVGETFGLSKRHLGFIRSPDGTTRTFRIRDVAARRQCRFPDHRQLLRRRRRAAWLPLPKRRDRDGLRGSGCRHA